MKYLTIKDIVKTYSNGTVSTKALDHLSLEVDKGEFVAIVGHSGSGKTTLFNMIAGLDEVDSGSINFNGIDITNADEDTRAAYRLNKIGIIYQFFNLIPMLNGRDNISLPHRFAGKPIDDNEVRKIAAALDIEDKLDSLPLQMSGGEQQRIAVARALFNECELLLADEPTGNLDQNTSHELIDLLLELNCSRQLTIILITHDMSVAEKASRIITIKDGQIINDVGNG